MQRILVVEDDPKTAHSVVAGLSAEGFGAALAPNSTDAVNSLAVGSYAVVVLDWMLPGCDGLEVLQTLRKRGNRVPVLLLTAREGAGAGRDRKLRTRRMGKYREARDAAALDGRK